MDKKDLPQVFRILQEMKSQWQDETLASREKDPFRILIGCILSLRTKDSITKKVANHLFSIAKTPAEILAIPQEKLAEIIYPVGFYRQKAKNLREIAQILLERYQGKVPDNLEQLLELPGVGRKTANLVVTVGFGKAGICVDTHVHRIVNRWGLVNTKTPEKTEEALRKELPQKYWIPINNLLVLWGQNICLPRVPRCSICQIQPFCEQKGVEKLQ
ncbi:MAG: endonuclease [Candidatus Atribacteria bacterium]|nr:endonuclease [Candidatus Atribacteria bacterium]